MLTQKILWAEFLWASNVHMKKNSGSNDIDTEYSMGKNLYGRNAWTRRQSLALMTLIQKTLWAEFLWAKRLYKKKNPRLSWHQHRRLHGQNSYGRNAHMKKIHGSTDISTEDTMGRIPMGETLVQEEKPLAIMTSTQKTPWAEFLWANVHMKKNHGSNDATIEDTMGRIPITLTWRKSTALLTSARKTLWAEFLWAKRLFKKKTPGYHDINTEDTMGRIPMGETLAQDVRSWNETSNTTMLNAWLFISEKPHVLPL